MWHSSKALFLLMVAVCVYSLDHQGWLVLGFEGSPLVYTLYQGVSSNIYWHLKQWTAAAWISTCVPHWAFLCMFWRCDSIVPDVTLQRKLSRLQKINFTSSSLKVWCNSSKPLSCWLSARNEQFPSGSTLLMHLLWIARNCSADCTPSNCCILVLF